MLLIFSCSRHELCDVVKAAVFGLVTTTMTRQTPCLLLAAVCISFACQTLALTSASSLHPSQVHHAVALPAHVKTATQPATIQQPIPFGNWTLVDVTEYGAVGDGKTDNSKAVQTALNVMLAAAGGANGGGASLYFPEGSYLFNSQIYIEPQCGFDDYTPLNFSIVGDNVQGSILLWNHTSDFLVIDSSNCWWVQISVQDLSIVAISDSCTSTSSSAAIYNRWSPPGGGRVLMVNMNISAVNVYPSGGCDFVPNGFSLTGQNTVVNNCTLSKIAHTGITGVLTVTNTIVTGIASPSDTQSTALLYPETVDNCDLSGFAFGIQTVGPVRGYGVNLMVTNSRIAQASQVAVSASLNVNLIINGCNFNGTLSPSATAVNTITGTMEGTSGNYEISNSWFNNWSTAISLTASDGSSVYGCQFESNGISIDAMFPSDSDATIDVENNSFINSCTLNLDAGYTLVNNTCSGNQTGSTFWCITKDCRVQENDSCVNFPSSSSKYTAVAQE